MQRALLSEHSDRHVHLPVVGQEAGSDLRAPPVRGAREPADLLPTPAAEGEGPRLISTPAPIPAPPPPCAFQLCAREAAAYPVVQLPPPTSASGQPLRIVFRRNPVCDGHRQEMAAALRVLVRGALTEYFVRRALPPADWDEARWEWEGVP